MSVHGRAGDRTDFGGTRLLSVAQQVDPTLDHERECEMGRGNDREQAPNRASCIIGSDAGDEARACEGFLVVVRDMQTAYPSKKLVAFIVFNEKKISGNFVNHEVIFLNF